MNDAKYLGLTANKLAILASDLDAENAKLRELAKITYAYLAWADGATFSDGRPAVHACDRREVEDRMRKLGVEVD